tara:strand:- start:260 stop:523 length:264 start_codon:yes stop_codon:yes gene_type:complete
MARKFVTNPGPTARYYRSHPKARAKHSRDETERNNTPAKKKYRADLQRRRRALKIDGKGASTGDISHPSMKVESTKKNRARGGAQRK